MAIGTYISIITLNVNGLSGPTKRHTLAEWIQKQDPYICLVFVFIQLVCVFLVGTFNSFTFKVIIDVYIPIAIFLIVWD